MPLNKELSDFERGRIIGQWECGKKTREIADALGLTQSQVTRAISAFRDKQQVTVQPRSGRPRSMSDRNIRYLAQEVRKITADELVQQMDEQLNISVSQRTIRSYLYEAGFHSRVGKRKPFISEQNRKKRLQWCKERRTWDNEWKTVIWSDESRFTLYQNDAHVRVWRQPREAYDVDCLVPTYKHGGGGIMVWGCFVNNQPGPLVLVEGKLNSDGYIKILQKNLLPFLSQLEPNAYIFQEDNAPIHTAKKVAKWKDENRITSFSWPAQSPDLNPIEHVWDRLERGIRGRTTPPKTFSELAAAVKEEWLKLDPNYLENLVESMPRRIKAVIASKGNPTPY